jgi:DNA replication protein DnaC
MEYSNEELSTQLKTLRLHYTADNLESIMGALENKSPREALSHLAAVESIEKKNRSINRRMAESRLGRFKRMEDFDWKHPTEINRPKVESLLEGDFTMTGQNLIIIGTQGLGKTMIARNLGAIAVQLGHTVRFVTASKLVSDLLSAGHNLESRLRYYARVELLIIDELGYLSYQDKAADMLFEVVSRRYEKAPILLTTNLTFAQWPEIFPGAACVSAILDRLIHHCEIVQIKGPSFRKKQSGDKKK